MAETLQQKVAKNTIVIGLTISLGLSILLYLATATPPADALIVGLVGTVITLLIDVVVRLDHLGADLALLRSSGKFGDRLRELLQGTARIVQTYDDRGPVPALVEGMDRLIEDLHNLENGRVSSQGGDYRRLLEAMGEAHSRLEAVTNVVRSGGKDLAWWQSEVGRKYWEANLTAMKKGVRISRIFIVESMADPSQELLDIMQGQVDAGVQVRWLRREDIEPAHHLNLSIWDGTVAWEAKTNAQGIQYENTLMYAARDVARLKRSFDVLHSMSKVFQRPQ